MPQLDTDLAAVGAGLDALDAPSGERRPSFRKRFVRTAVPQEYAAAGYDFIKVTFGLTPEVYDAIAASAATHVPADARQSCASAKEKATPSSTACVTSVALLSASRPNSVS